MGNIVFDLAKGKHFLSTSLHFYRLKIKEVLSPLMHGLQKSLKIKFLYSQSTFSGALHHVKKQHFKVKFGNCQIGVLWQFGTTCRIHVFRSKITPPYSTFVFVRHLPHAVYILRIYFSLSTVHTLLSRTPKHVYSDWKLHKTCYSFLYELQGLHSLHSTSLRYYICFLCNFLKVQYSTYPIEEGYRQKSWQGSSLLLWVQNLLNSFPQIFQWTIWRGWIAPGS